MVRGRRGWGVGAIRVLGGILALSGLALLAGRFGIGAKAVLADLLIARALDAHLEDGRPHPPWSGADFHPIGRLEVPRLCVRRALLSSGSGTAMAFGVERMSGGAELGTGGTTLLVGHRDTRLAFLEELRIGDQVRLTTHEGDTRWRVRSGAVIHEGEASVHRAGGERLILITCYPFGGLLRTPWRYAVECVPYSLPSTQTPRSAGGISSWSISTTLSERSSEHPAASAPRSGTNEETQGPPQWAKSATGGTRSSSSNRPVGSSRSAHLPAIARRRCAE